MQDVQPAPAPESDVSSSLVPPVLRAPLALLWLWVVPIALMLAVNYRAYLLLEGDMSEGQRSQSLLFGLAAGADLLVGLILFVSAVRSPAVRVRWPERSWWWGLAAVVLQAGYLWYAVSNIDEVVSWSWIYSPERFISVQFSFAMLPLFWGIVLAAGVRYTRKPGLALGVNLALAIGAPVVLFLVVNTIRFVSPSTFPVVLLVTLVVLLAIAMFVGIVGAMLQLFRTLQGKGDWIERAAIILFAGILPVCGLLLNRAIPFPVNFQATEVYVLAVANAAVLLFASYQARSRPRVSFALLWATFPFSLYFFFIFLPYTPLSILAVVVVGTGFLVLTPTFLFVLHLHLLNQARRSPGFAAGRLPRVLLATLALAVLPAYFTVRALADKAALHAALDYVFTPRIGSDAATFSANLPNLQRAIRSHRAYKNGIYYPLLSDYYAWLVFDGLVLPDDKLARLEKIFLGEKEKEESFDPIRNSARWGEEGVRQRTRMPRVAPLPRTVDVAALHARVQAAGAGNSLVTFALTLRNRQANPAEYVAQLPLPAGACVTGFRLSVNGTLVPGRIFEKKTALWVYAMIRDSERRDPGILYYDDPTTLGLKVSPVAGAGGAPSTVEIDLLVPTRLANVDALSAVADPAQALRELDNLLAPRLADDAAGGAVLGGLHADVLPAVAREPYLHLIVDRSAANAFDGDLATALRALHEKFPAARMARVSLANFEVGDEVRTLTPLSALLTAPPPDYRRHRPAAGGLFLDLAIARAIRTHVELDLDAPNAGDAPPPRPIFVVVAKRAVARTLEAALTEAWSETLPGLDLVEWGADGSYRVHHAAASPATPLLRLRPSVRPVPAHAVVRFAPTAQAPLPEYYSPATGHWEALAGVERQAATEPWPQAMALQSRNVDLRRAVAGPGTDLSALVEASRATGILLPATSYIVVERNSQWRMLERSENLKLGQNTALAFKEAPVPPSGWIVLGFAAWLAARVWRRRTVSRRA